MTEKANPWPARCAHAEAQCFKLTRLLQNATETIEQIRNAMNHAATFGADRTMDAIMGVLDSTTIGCDSPPDAWIYGSDRPLPEDEEIKAAFPTRSNRYDLYQEAMRMVGARYSKHGLVALVNMLLHRSDALLASIEQYTAARDEARKLNDRERWLTTPLGIMGRRTVDDLQYEELRALACRLAGVPFVSLTDVMNQEQKPSCNACDGNGFCPDCPEGKCVSCKGTGKQ